MVGVVLHGIIIDYFKSLMTNNEFCVFLNRYVNEDISSGLITQFVKTLKIKEVKPF